MKPIFLLGYMGCGKTTLGKALAREMCVEFIDLDEFIERKCDATVAQIFDEMGEKRFRQLECEALHEVATMNDVVVACGGGTPCQDGNMQFMNDVGITVWLTTSIERIVARLLLPEEKCKRPKIMSLPDEAVMSLVKQELEKRTPYYSQAQVQFDSTDIETAPATIRTARRLAAVLECR